MAPSSRNGSWMEKFEAPTSFMIPVSRRRLNAATRIVFTIRITDTRIISSASPPANHCTQLSTLKNFSSSAFWSCTCSTPARPTNALATMSNCSGSTSLTRNDSGIWSAVTLSTIAEFLNCSLKRVYACCLDS